MPIGKYMLYNIVGGLSWIVSFLALGYFFGNLPFVKQNFSLVVLSIILLSVIPAIFAALKPTKK
jgi:membrane-associated protein